MYAILAAAQAVSVIDTSSLVELARYDVSVLGTPALVAAAGSRLFVAGIIALHQVELGVVDMTIPGAGAVDLWGAGGSVLSGLAAREVSPGVDDVYLGHCSMGCSLDHDTYAGGPSITIEQQVFAPNIYGLVLAPSAGVLVSGESLNELTLRAPATLAVISHIPGAAGGSWDAVASSRLVQAGYDAQLNKFSTIEVRDMTGALTFKYSSTQRVAIPVPEPGSADLLVAEQGSADLVWRVRTFPGALLDPTVSQAPAGLSATAAASGRIALSWTPPAQSGNNAPTGYRVLRSTSADQVGTVVATLPDTSTSYVDAGPSNATRYYYRVTALDLAGDSAPSAQATAVADAAAPTTTLVTPATPFQVSRTVTANYTATDALSGVASYDVRYRTAVWNAGFGAYSYPISWQHTTATSKSLTASLGHAYCLSVRARDHVGNLSAWSAERCTTLPLDDRSLAATTSGWTRLASGSAFQGTLTRAFASGTALRLNSAHTDLLGLVVTTCSTCGNVAIYLNGVYWRTVSTHSSTTHAQVILMLPRFSLRIASVTLKKASSGGQAIIDGLAISRV